MRPYENGARHVNKEGRRYRGKGVIQKTGAAQGVCIRDRARKGGRLDKAVQLYEGAGAVEGTGAVSGKGAVQWRAPIQSSGVAQNGVYGPTYVLTLQLRT